MNRVQRRTRGERGVITILGTMMLLFILIPVVGLAIDSGVMYLLKAKLQASADGAALAAARGLSQALDLASQQTAARDVAKRWFHANFPNNWMGVGVVADPTVSFPAASPRTMIVQVSASITAPTWFMKILGFQNLTINATSEATRRFVNIMLVLDRSGSLYESGSCDAVAAAAKTFINSFVNGQDRLGMVTFGTDYRVDLPPTYNFATGSPNLPAMMDQLYCYGYTNAAAAYWTAYQQLVNINDAGALNVILFFTDGMPNTITFGVAADGTDNRMPVKTQTTPHTYTDPLGYGFDNKDKSKCKSNAGLSGVLTPIGGIYKKDATSYPASAAVDAQRIGDAEGDKSNGCTFDAYFNANVGIVSGGNPSRALAGPGFTALFDVAYIPEEDIFRNMTGTGYGGGAPYITVDRYTNAWPAGYRNKIRVDNLATCAGSCQISVDDNISRAGINALDYAAQNARNDSVTRSLNVYTYTIGLGNGPGGVDDELLRRVANDRAAGNFDSSQPEGKYLMTPTTAQLNQAFTEIASSVLRVSR